MSSSVIWESMKAYLRGQIILYSAHVKKTLGKHHEQLTKSILELDMKIANMPSPDLLNKRLTHSTRHAENRINQSWHKTYEFVEKTGKILALSLTLFFWQHYYSHD